ncbi:MAG: DUF4153 domain-containing protein [Novosphingobium sp.]
MRLMLARRRDGAFVLKLALAAAAVGLGDFVFWQQQQFAGVQGLFGLALVAALALARPAVRRDKRARIALGLAAVYACAQLWDPSPLAFLLFWVAMGLAVLLPGTAKFDDGWRWFQRLLVHGFKSLFGPLIDLTILSRVRRNRPAGPLGLRRSLPVLVLPLLGSVLFVWLFAQANPVIERWIAALSLPEFDWTVVPHLILLGALFTMAWGVLRPRPPRRMFGTFDGSGDVVLPGISLASVTLSLAAFNALFAMQNLMDLGYLSGAIVLPKGITLADYAHRGAYPLVATALLAALFVLVTMRPGSSTAASPLVRRLVTLWTVQNVVLVLSAAVRTWDYVEAYSLTVLRLSALLWMALVAVGLVLVLVRMLRGKSASWLINANLVAAGLLLTPVCFIDLGAVSARWNVRHAKEIDGDGAKLDLCYLNELKGSALLSLVELERRPLPEPLHQQIRSVRNYVMQRMAQHSADGGWSLALDYRLDKARRIVGPETADHDIERPCYGRYDN